MTTKNIYIDDGWVYKSYESITWFVFSYSPTSTDWVLHNKTHVALDNMQMKHQQNSDFPLYSCSYQKCTFVDPCTEYIGPSNCVEYWVWNYYFMKFEEML